MEETITVWSTAGETKVDFAWKSGDSVAIILTADAGDDGSTVALDRDGALRLMLALADFVRNS